MRWAAIACYLAFCAVLLWLALTPCRAWHALQQWPAAPATILSAQVRSFQVHKRLYYLPFIVYEYRDPRGSGKLLTAHGFHPTRLKTGDRGECQAVVERFPVGSVQTCFVDPADAGSAYLTREFADQLALTVLAALGFCLVISVSAMNHLAVMWTRRALDASLSPRPVLLVGPRPAAPHGAVVIATVALFLVAAAFANRGLSRLTTPAPWLDISLAAVGLQGAVIIAAAIRRWRAASAAPLLTVDGPLLLGGRVILRWEVPASFGQVSGMAISLLAVEHSRTQRGSPRVAPIAPYAPLALVGLEQPAARAGSTVLALPEPAPATFEHRFYGIGWSVCLDLRDSRGRPWSFAAPIAVGAARRDA